jgi:tetratricopeptide (TPR) repeat protein
MNEPSSIRLTGLENVNVGGHLSAEIDQSVNKTVIFSSVPKQSQPIPSDERSGSPNFVGRVQDLKDLHQALQQEDVVAVCAVRGMGGIGKTELAIQYAQSRLAKESYVAHYWFALNRGSLAAQVLDRAMPYLAMPEEVLKSPSLERQVQWCWQNWQPTEGQVLVIIDDVQGLSDIPSNLLPLGSRFKVLLTTRQRNLSPSFRELALGVLSEDESLQLLQKIVDKASPARVATEWETAKGICRAVGYLPLALELAATYLLRDPLLTLADYLAQLHLLDESLSDEMVRGITAERGAIAAFTLSWQRLSEEAQGLAMLLGQFGAAEIPVDYWLEQTVAVLGWEKGAVGAARKLLMNLSLIEITAARSIALHPLLRQYYRYHAGQRGGAFIAELHGGIVTRGIEIARTIPQVPVKADIERVGLAIPHLEEMGREMLADIANPEEDLIWAFLGAARFYDGQARYSFEEDLLQRCLTTLENQLGADHPDVATSLNNLAFLYYLQGRYSEAEPLYLRSLSLRESQLGADYPDVATSLNDLALLYESQGRYSEAEPLYLRSLSIYESQLGANHPNVATSLNNLAVLYEYQGRYSEAEPLYLRSLSLRESQLGADHPDVAQSLNNLALLYESQGRYSEAEPLYLRSLSINESQLGADHPEVATDLNNLGGLYRAQGRYSEAEPLFLRSLSIHESQLGADHPHVATSLNNLAELYRSQGRYSEAEPLYLRSLSIRESLLGTEHPDVATRLNNLASLYQAQGHYSEAEPLFLRSLSIRESQLGADHPDVATSLNNLAALYESQGRYSEAEPLLLRSIAIAEQSLGNDHPSTQLFRKNLQILQQQQVIASLAWWQWLILIPFLPFILLWQLLRWLLHLFH